MSNRRNLANAILKDPVSDSATTWELVAGYGDAMPPAVPYHLTATPFGQLSTLGNSEVVLVTARTLDTLTVVRGQKGTTAQSFLAGAVISNGIMVDDVIGTEVTVSTAATTAAKVGTTTDGNYTPVLGDRIIVTFVNGSNIATPTLNIDGSGAKNIRLGQTNANTLTMGLGTAAGSNVKIQMWYDGTYWQLYGANDNANTTYTEIPEAEIDAGTASTGRSITGRRSLYIINKAIAGAVSAVQALTNWVTTAMLQDGAVTYGKINLATFLAPATLTGSTSNGNSNDYVSVTGSYTFVANVPYLIIFSHQMSRTDDSGTVFEHRLQVDGTTIGTCRLQANVQVASPALAIYTPSSSGSKTVRVISPRLAGSSTFNIELPKISIVPLQYLSA